MRNKKIFTNGDIVYWCKYSGRGVYDVEWGMVYAQYADTVIIEYLSVMETRMVDGIPIEKFADEPKFKRLRKLPKDWTYSTRLFEITHRLLPEYKLDVTDPENIKDAYAKGFLVKKETI